MVFAEDDDLAGLEDVSSDAEEDEAEWIDSEAFPSGNAQARKIHGSRKKHRGMFFIFQFGTFLINIYIVYHDMQLPS